MTVLTPALQTPHTYLLFEDELPVPVTWPDLSRLVRGPPVRSGGVVDVDITSLTVTFSDVVSEVGACGN